MCHSETESVVMTEVGDRRSEEMAIAVECDQFTAVADTSIPVRNHTSMELEVFAHGRITPVGSPPQTTSQDRVTPHIVRIGPVPLDIRPLSDYQQSLIDTILSLKSKG